MGRLGLRARGTVAFALATNQLIRQREQWALRLTVVNARLVQDGLGAPDPDVAWLLATRPPAWP